MPPEPLLTSAGWSLDGLIMRGHRFREIPRVSVSDKNLDATIRDHESSGVPLVIEGMHEHQAWPTAMFDIQWLCDNLKQQIQVRNVRNRRDLDVSFAEFLEHIKSIHRYASADETSRWYAKDVECPCEWKEWLDKTSLVPRSLCPHGPGDIMQNLPEQARVETLMCYLGIGDTFTPCHKDLCASFGHNLMCYTEDGASAFWFMTESSAAPLMAKYFQSLGQELDLESHTMSIEEFATAPCDVYITEQKAGDLVLVPPKSCHQVVNHGSLTVKMSWSRLTIRSTQIALHDELPIYRRVCRVETYRIKSTIHHTLRRKTVLLENMWRKDNCAGYHDIFRVQLANDVQKLLELFREVILEERCPGAETLDHVIRDFSHNIYDSEGYPAFSCDFCGSDIFVSFFGCKRCSPSAKSPSSISDGLHICPGCCVEGRSCGCGGLMKPLQCWPLQILCGDYNRAVRALKGGGVDVFDEVADCGILNNNMTSVFEAGIAIQQWRAEVNKGGSLCHASLAQPHAVQNAAILHCKKCRKGHCFVHLAEAGIHSSEAITLYKKSQEQSTWHEFHLSKRTSPNQETILAAEASGDDVSNLIGQKRAIVALSFSHCQPLNNTPHIKLGWYDKPKSSGVATLGSSYAMDMSFPRDGGDWGSPLTEDSISNTLVGSETPPGESERAKSRSSVPATFQFSTDVAVDSMKRKRSSVVFDGVAPPERRRRTSARNSGSPPSAGLAPRSATSVKGDEKGQGPRSTAALESSRLQAMIDTLTSTVVAQDRKLDVLAQDNKDLRDRIRNLSQTLHVAQNRKLDVLVQGNAHLRDELQHLSQTVQSSKKDIQRVENISNNMASELKGKLEYMLEKSENRILGPINRLSEELDRIRANPPPPPIPVPSSTAFPPTAPYPPEPPAGDGEWTSPDDYTPTESNKPHYQESWGNYRQPNHKYGRGGFRPYRGRGRGSRGGFSGNRPPNQRHNPEGWGQPYRDQDQAMPFTPAAAPPESAPTPVVHPASDSYHPQGYAPPLSRHTSSSSSSHSYPHPSLSPSTNPRPYPHAHGNANTRAHPHTAPSTSPVLATTAPSSSSSQPNSHRVTAAHPSVYEHKHVHARPHDHHQSHPQPHQPPPPPPPPRSHEWRQSPASAPASTQAQAAADDGGYGETRYGDSTYTVRSPTPSDGDRDEPGSDSVAAGGQRRHGHGHHDSQSQSRTSGPSRGYVGRGHSRHADEVRSGGWR